MQTEITVFNGETFTVERSNERRPAIVEIQRLHAKLDACKAIVAAAQALDRFAHYSSEDIAKSGGFLDARIALHQAFVNAAATGLFGQQTKKKAAA